ncbi:Inorganic pyrophosphatase 2 [Heracleum sosnowskyi]|uniref:Inorganic pyrophosphatase 2 n=1 Tax=Heracleum sosnowskyi TaxID=360622 RepID=A0AAD8HAZ1_9APIA|nr:Inorganic pyrophosphatase 2 [Heracleum sosnowskyi]
MAGIVVVFDFDKTILEVDSDNWVVDELDATAVFDQLLNTMPWNTLMDRMMTELHSKGKTTDDIANVLKKVPIHPQIITAVKAAHAFGCDLRIVSDANSFFIETILEHFGITECFSEINTNPSFIDEEGRLRISPYHDFRHGCKLCPPNMCKGMIIERIQREVDKKTMIYLGDGAGDYCPSLKLEAGDYVMPRKNFPVWELICENRDMVKAEIHEWSDGDEFAKILLHLIDEISTEVDDNQNINTNDCGTTARLFSLDCDFSTSTIPVHEALPQPLPAVPVRF